MRVTGNCWSGYGWRGKKPGFVLEPNQVVTRLVEGMKRNGTAVARISGGEPSLYWDHIVEVVRDFLERTHDKAMVIEGVTDRVGVPFAIIIETNGSVLTHEQLEQLDNIGDDAYRAIVNFGIKATHPEALAELTGMTLETADRFHQTQMDNFVFAVSRLERIGVLATFLDAYTDPRIYANLQRRVERWMPGGGQNLAILTFKKYRSVKRAYVPKRFRFGSFLDELPSQEPETLCNMMNADGTFPTVEQLDEEFGQDDIHKEIVVADHEEACDPEQEYSEDRYRQALQRLQDKVADTDLGQLDSKKFDDKGT